jgi:hypothetical protein
LNRRAIYALFSAIVVAAAISIPAGGGAAAPSHAASDRFIGHVRYLAAPELQGRGAGTAGLERAADYIAGQFKRLGLQPGGQDGSYWQAFRVTTDAKLGPQNQIVATGAAGSTELRLKADFLPLSFSSNGRVSAAVVFAGYGITAPEFHYDDYLGLDVRDKIVVALRYEPKHFRKGAGDRETAWTHHAHLVSKAINARNHGARAILLVNGELPEKQTDDLIRFGSVAGPENAGILMAHATNSAAAAWFSVAGKSLPELQRQMNEKAQPVSFAFPESLRISLQVDIERRQAGVRNVLGFLPGRSKEYVILGAHYDHLGFGNESSLAPSLIGHVHPGADDNASGAAGLLESARLLAAKRGDLPRGVLFAAFAGEEIGLLGSSEWVNHPSLPIENAVAMINMDMIGRVSGSKLYIGGAGTGSTFQPMLKETGARHGFDLNFSQDAYSSSDHTSFAAKSIPVLFFFSGLHGDYHKPSDTWDKINGPASARVVDLVVDVATHLIEAGNRPQFVKVQAPAHGHGMPGGSGSGYGPYFGSIPDFAPVDKGVRFSDVRAGSPAAKAGLQGGDILIGFGEKPINNLYDFTFALRESKVGDVVAVKYLRGGKEQTAQVTLEPRP